MHLTCLTVFFFKKSFLQKVSMAQIFSKMNSLNSLKFPLKKKLEKIAKLQLLNDNIYTNSENDFVLG